MSEIRIPKCVGIIMDGNRRWARKNNFPPLKGHLAGVDALKRAVETSNRLGIKHIIFYTFSTENWKRKEEEVSYLLKLIEIFVKKELKNFIKLNGVLHFSGDLSKFSPKLQKVLKDAKDKTKNNTGMNIYIALNYGGRSEILNAVKTIVKEGPKPKDITEDYFSKYLYTYPMPDVDMIIRTSGEMRLSGFLPWQSVYSELFFTKTLWPDFEEKEFKKMIEEYNNRERRIGK